MSATADKLPEANKLYIGRGVTIKVGVLTSDTVIVDGFLEGDASVGNLLVSETGTIKGRINVAENAEIFGKVFERLDVKGLLVLRSTCRVDGNVSCGSLQIEQGANITGAIASTDRRADQPEFKSVRDEASRPANGNSTLQRLDLSALELAPSPFPAAS
jgi:cytoskeletal protein CcmA (bactofilin family)